MGTSSIHNATLHAAYEFDTFKANFAGATSQEALECASLEARQKLSLDTCSAERAYRTAAT